MKNIQVRKAFGKRIVKYRKGLGLSQETLADMVGVHRTYIGALERGEQSVSLDNINRIAKALKVKPADLLE
ncbi:MAG: helix-turn-helix transcriptional regulator [Candidatus Paceibacterota bacterium]|jgi:transcriptional regulator with XRE-family HTH domain